MAELDWSRASEFFEQRLWWEKNTSLLDGESSRENKKYRDEKKT